MSDPSVLEARLLGLSILRAMYPELLPSSETSDFLHRVHDQLAATPTPTHLDFILPTPLPSDPTHSIEMVVRYRLTGDSGQTLTITPRQPGWLSRSSYEKLLGDFPSPREDCEASEAVLEATQYLELRCTPALSNTSGPAKSSSGAEASRPGGKAEQWERVWFWFPSLSMKEKRRDLVDYAPRYGLTGFFLSGKPGLLCLEGETRQVDKYMSAIKSESWSDIPSYQKKVTERLRNRLVGVEERKFASMTDITDQIPTYGQYNHRGEMGEVKRLMDSWGVGEDFGAVVLGSK